MNNNIQYSSKYRIMTGTDLWDFLERNKPFTEAYIIAPYFSKNGLAKLLKIVETKKRRCKIQMIILKDILSIATGVIDIEGLEQIIDSDNILKYNSKFEIKWIPNLHTKMYLFKKGNICVIGSSNLTSSGFGGKNIELNIVWQNSSKMMQEGQKIFNLIWKNDQCKIIDNKKLSQIKNNLDIPKLKALKKSIEILKSTSSNIYEFSMKDKEHQSYQVLKKIKSYLKTGKTWNSLTKYITKIGKGDSINQSEIKLLFLINNNLLTQKDNKLVLTEYGENIVNDSYYCFLWLIEIEPKIIKIITQLNLQKELTYSDFITEIGIESKYELYCPIHWLKSLGILTYSKRKERLWKLTKKGIRYLKDYEYNRKE
ncbi:MAG: phospholipase D-like domain-containing protein [Fidelibacterota bacterium]